MDDVPSQYLEELKGVYRTKVKVSKEEVIFIENTQEHGSVKWEERKVRVTASKVGSLLKMRTTKRNKKVEAVLYSTFRGSQATRYGELMETKSRLEYKTYQ